MTYSKAEQFNENLQETAQIAKLLSHPARLAIIEFLSNQESCMSGNISDEIPLSRTTVSQHLQELKNAKIIIGTIEGIKVNYCINFFELNRAFELMKIFFEASLKNCNSMGCKTKVKD